MPPDKFPPGGTGQAVLDHTGHDPDAAKGNPMTEKRKRIAIVGGDFAGLTAAIKLSRRHVVTRPVATNWSSIPASWRWARSGTPITSRA
jgi:hypothetical protein